MNDQLTVAWITAAALALHPGSGVAATASEKEPALSGRWDAVVVAAGVDVPFPFEISGDGATLAAARSSTASGASRRPARLGTARRWCSASTSTPRS